MKKISLYYFLYPFWNIKMLSFHVPLIKLRIGNCVK